MKTQNLLTVWAKRALCLLALAATAGLMLPACDKNKIDEEPFEQYDEEIYYYHNNNDNPKWHVDTIRKYASDKYIRYIYITIAPGETFTHLDSYEIAWHRRQLQFAMKETPKCRGRGNFEFTPGCCLTPDSLDFVDMGFTVNQQNQ